MSPVRAIPETADAQRFFADPAGLDELRRGVLEGVGLPWGMGILYGIGMAQGLTDGLRVARRFLEALGAPAQLAGGSLPLLFSPERGLLPGRFAGTLAGSIEARLHCARRAESPAPVCMVSAGYAAGWYSALLSDFYLIKETACVACGAPVCQFEARRAQRWIDSGDRWAAELLPYLDYAQLRATAQERVDRCAEATEDTLLGQFDAMSPAVHVWGPVMVLPYSGADDSAAAIDTIRSDVGQEQLQVVVIDTTGVRLDPVEQAGLLRLIDVLEARDLEAVVTGLREPDASAWLRSSGALSLPLTAPSLTAAIALAFQLCGGHQV
jgi:hypothetical protein